MSLRKKMPDDHVYPWESLDVFRLGASEDKIKAIGRVSPRDGLFHGPSSNDGDDDKQPVLEPHAVQASRSKPNFDDKGQRPVLEPSMPQVSTPATPTNTETNHREECESLYKRLLSQRADTKATVLSAGDLRRMFEALGMSHEVPENDLREVLMKARYADGSGLLDIEYFTIFAEDFELLESLHVCSASQREGHGEYSERGPVGVLFYALAAIHKGAKDREECDDCFQQLLAQRGDPTATVLRARDLCEMLKTLGMPTKVKENELQDMLTSSEYADGNGTMDFERFMIFAGDFMLLKSLRAFTASQQKGGEYAERGPLVDIVKIFESGGLKPGIPRSSSHDGGMRKEPIFEPPVLPSSTSESPIYRDIRHRRECQRCCIWLLSRLGDPNTTAFLAGALCGMLKELGMAPEVTDDKLRDMLKFSGYTDEDGTLDFEQFAIIAKDFALLESLRVHKALRVDGLKWSYAEFFDKIASGETIQYKSADFSEAFDTLSIKLTDEFANILAQYANLDPGNSITFEEFVHRRDSEHLQRTGQTMSSHRNVALNKGYRLGRLMAFVSSYIRSYRPRKFGYNANS